MARDTTALAYAIKRSCEIKARVVAQDEREAGLRAILNFGHAIETSAGYGYWLHGTALGCVMVMAADLSTRLGLIDGQLSRRIRRLFERARLPIFGRSSAGRATLS